MLKYLRADLYKLFKSRIMWICYGVCFVTLMFFASTYYQLSAEVRRLDCVTTVMLQHQNIVTYAILLSASLFLSKDYNAKFFKNIPNKSLSSRLFQVLSKIICLIILILAFYLLWLGLNCVSTAARYYGDYGMGVFYGLDNMYVDGRQILSIEYTVQEWLKADALYLLLAFAATMIIMAMGAIFRNAYALVLTTLGWSVICPFVFYMIDPLFKLEHKTLRHYTVFGGMLSTGDIIDFAKANWDLYVPSKMITVSVVAIVICFVISWILAYIREER